MQFFYDTNVLLSGEQKWFNQQDKFFISSVTIEQLENIKHSETKNPQIKYLARKASKWLVNNTDKYIVYLFNEEDKFIRKNFPFTIDSPDKKILATALKAYQKDNYFFTFLTYDFNCYLFASTLKLNTTLLQKSFKPVYNGYHKIVCTTDEELAEFYTKINSNSSTDSNSFFKDS